MQWLSTNDIVCVWIFERLNMRFRFLSESFSFLPDSMLPFFCGSSVTCRTLADAKALNISLQRWLNWWREFLPEHPYILHPHIVAWTSFIPFLYLHRQGTIFNRLHSDFTVVSVLEQLEVGLEVLECLLPSYFKVGQVAMFSHIVNHLTLLWPCKLDKPARLSFSCPLDLLLISIKQI